MSKICKYRHLTDVYAYLFIIIVNKINVFIYYKIVLQITETYCLHVHMIKNNAFLHDCVLYKFQKYMYNVLFLH